MTVQEHRVDEGLRRQAARTLHGLRLGVVLLLAATHLAMALPAGAATLTFEGLVDRSKIPDGYGGLNWNENSYALNATAYSTPSGYQTGRVSGDYVAYNAYGSQAAFSVPSGTFTFVSAHITSAWYNDNNVRVQGLRAGSTIYDQTVVANTTASAFFTFNYAGVDTVTISTSRYQIAIDNLTVAFNVCPNSVVEAGEGCDDGNGGGGDGCSASCTVESGYACSGSPSACATVCGDSIIAGGEACDDGNAASGDGCSNVCTIETGFSCSGAPSTCSPICADSLVAGNEPCDDGDVIDGDGCSATCTLEPGFTCSGEPSMCFSTCGDGIPVGNEECDDGGLVDDDGCSVNCIIEPTFQCVGAPSTCLTDCGNSVIDLGEDCDDGARVNGDGCSKVCLTETYWSCSGAPSTCTPICGDGTIAGNEECDDLNTTNNDCCSATCSFEPNNVACLVGAAGEATGSFTGPFQHFTGGWEFTVQSDLTVTSLGVYDCGDNGMTQSHQVGIWDKAGPQLVTTVTIPAGSGSDLVDHFRHQTIPGLTLEAGHSYVIAATYPQSGTDCVVTHGSFAIDPRVSYVVGREIFSPLGFIYPTTPSAAHMTVTFHFSSVRGDGVVDGDEQCDDGEVTSGDGCSSNGAIETGYACSGAPSACATVCGDGILAGTEACDDGDAVAGDGCSDTCAIESGYTCRNAPSTCTNSCGDGVVDGGEFCDDGNPIVDDGCGSDCTVDASYFCTGAPSVCTTQCGDGVLQITPEFEEECDDANLIDGDCCSKNCLFEPTSTACRRSMGNPSGGGGSGGVGVVEGWEFTVNSPVTIAALGVFDESSVPGLSENQTVGIWDSSQNLLATAVVPAGTDTTLVGSFRYVPIAGLSLAAGQSYTIGAYMPPPRNDLVIGAPSPVLDPRLTFVQGRRLPFVGSLVFPTSTSSDARVGPGFLLELTGCGDGGADAGEACDDGNLTDGDCCSSACQVFAGTCSDANACTTVDTCQAGACVGSVALGCDDGNACSQDSCDPGSGCVHDSSPRPSCKNPGSTTLAIKDRSGGDADKLTWKWTKGDTALAELGNPTSTTSYGLCVFDEVGGVPTPVFNAEIPAGANWEATSTRGFKYKDKLGVNDGISQLVVREGAIDRAKVSLTAKGANLAFGGTLPLAQDTQVLVQLHNSDGTCWQSEFAAPASKNLSDEFKDKAP